MYLQSKSQQQQKTISLTRTEQYHTTIYVPIISVQLKYLTPFETDTLMKTSSVVTCNNE